MIAEVTIERENAREAYLNAKEAYENFRDGYIPYLDDPEEYKAELQRLMDEMDDAEDWYDFTCMEYSSVMSLECHSDMNENAHRSKHIPAQLEDLYRKAEEARQRYDDLAHGRIPFMGGKEALASELERLRHEWQMALDKYNDEYERLLLELKRKKMHRK